MCYYVFITMPPLHGNTFNGSPDRHVLVGALPDKPLKTIPEVITVMGGMSKLLPRAGLEHLVPFNDIYRLMTISVYRRLLEGKFNRPDVVEVAVPDFAHRWIDPVTQFGLGNRKGMSRTWEFAMYHPFMKYAEPAIQFGSGMIPHVRVDLAGTADAIDAPEDYKDDYTYVVGDSLREVAEDIADDYLPIHGVIQHVATEGTLLALGMWREQSWQAGLELRKARGHEAKRYAINERLDQQAVLTSRAALLGDFGLKAAQVFFPAA